MQYHKNYQSKYAKYSNNLHKHNDIIEENQPKLLVERIYLLLIFVIFAFLTITFKLFDLTFTSIEDLPQIINSGKKVHNFTMHRGSIMDKNGLVLATNIPTASLYAHPNQIVNHKRAALQIASVLEDIKSEELLEKLNSAKSFIWIKRHVTPEMQQKVHDLGIPGVYFTDDEKRFYPTRNLFAHTVGYVDIDGVGMAGIERAFNSELENNKDVQLTLDIRIQYLMMAELKKAIELHSAARGSAVLLNAKNGEIVSMVSLPDFDPNNITKDDGETIFNQVTLAVQEMGSVMKVLTFAMAIDLGKLKMTDVFDVSKPIKIGKFTIHDYRGKGGTLSSPEVLMYSSNIGLSQIARRIGIRNQKDYLRRSGALNSIDFDFLEKGRPIYPSESRWNESSLITISYGHGIAITPLHAIQIFAMIVNGGMLHPLKIVKGLDIKTNDDNTQNEYEINEIVSKHNKESKRVIKEETSVLMRKLLRLVVTDGFSRKANIKGYLVGGKTGTAEKVKNGRYLKNSNTAVFIAAFPIHDPEYVLFVSVDEAKANSINHGFTTGGMIAAPLGGEIIKKIGQVLPIQFQNEEDQEVQQILHLEYTPYCKNKKD